MLKRREEKIIFLVSLNSRRLNYESRQNKLDKKNWHKAFWKEAKDIFLGFDSDNVKEI